MVHKFSHLVSICCGIALVLILMITLVTDTNPVGLSRNILSNSQKVKKLFCLPGEMFFDGEDTFFNVSNGNLKTLDFHGRCIKQEDISDRQILWSGPDVLVLSEGSYIEIRDKDGQNVLGRQDILENMRVLDVSERFLLIAGEKAGKEYAALLGKQGEVLWLKMQDGKIISGNTTNTGMFTALAVLDEDICGKIVMVNSKGEVAWSLTREYLPLFVRVLDDNIIAITENGAFAKNDKKDLWDIDFKGIVTRGHIDEDGYISAVIAEKFSEFSKEKQYKIIEISPQGKVLWSYVLDEKPEDIQRIEDFIYILDESGILILTRQGLLKSKINIKGIKQFKVVDSSHIIVFQNKKSCLLEILEGRK